VRLPRVTEGFPPAGAASANALSRDGQAGHPLFGGWSATRWQYTSAADPGRTVDVVTDLKGSITLSLAASAFILAFDVAGRGKHSISGACEVRGEELLLVAAGTDRAERVAFHQTGDTLSLRSDESGWDFDGQGRDQGAAFVAVLVRL
jgi:hypothetical protein